MTKARKTGKSKNAGQAARQTDQSVNQNNAESVAVMGAGGGHIDQIRDIIFGQQMADYEARFRQLEERINSQIDALREETDNRFMAMKEAFEKQNAALDQQLKTEQSKRVQEDKSLAKTIAQTEKALSKAIDALSARHDQDVQSLQDQISALSSEISDEMHIQQVETTRNLEAAVEQLDNAKVTRQVLSQLLVDLAGHISEESQ